MTADELSERYVVGLERLLAYANRGNLACRRLESGTALFDEEGVARFFRPRRGGIVVTNARDGEHLGVLGVARMGDTPNGALSGGARRRRPLHSDVAPSFPSAHDALGKRASSG